MPFETAATGTIDLNAINDIVCGMAVIMSKLIWLFFRHNVSTTSGSFVAVGSLLELKSSYFQMKFHRYIGDPTCTGNAFKIS